uniref:Caspase 9 n=1 Tax=Latimeria chalumnae TaxID=7897 RepID=H3BFW5_LATCH
MDDRQRKILQRNRAMLVEKLDPSKIYDLLISKDVFTQDMIEEIKAAGPRRDQARQLVTDLQTRGSQAFSIFLECLKETEQRNLADLLREGLHFQPAGPINIKPIKIPQIINKHPDQEFSEGLLKFDDVSPCLGRLSSEFNDPRRNQSPTHVEARIQVPVQCSDIETLDSGGTRSRRNSGKLPKAPTLEYKMDSSPCGYCLIINNVEFADGTRLNCRNGSDIDSTRLQKRFESFDFIVETCRNVTQKEMDEKLISMARKDHSQFDCFVLVILSHGNESQHIQFPGAIYTTDGALTPVQQIVNYFNGSQCQTLRGKPKLFFLQACGGGKQHSVQTPTNRDESPLLKFHDTEGGPKPVWKPEGVREAEELKPAITDFQSSNLFLVLCSSAGYVSWRDRKVGSWYVEVLDKVFEKYGHDEDLLSLLVLVTDQVSQNSARGVFKQIPGCFNFLRKRLFFRVK